MYIECPTCLGTGNWTGWSGDDEHTQKEGCPICEGTGKLEEMSNMTVKEFFDKYVHHMDDCQKGITSETCTCGLMQNLPYIFSLALTAERLEKHRDS